MQVVFKKLSEAKDEFVVTVISKTTGISKDAVRLAIEGSRNRIKRINENAAEVMKEREKEGNGGGAERRRG